MEVARAEAINLVNRMSVGRRDVKMACDYQRKILAVKSPYHMHYVDKLKERIPSSEREWNPENRLWLVSTGYFNIILQLIAQYLPNSVVVHGPNLNGLELLIPKVKSQHKRVPTVSVQLTMDVVKQLNEEPSDGSNEDLLSIILMAWKNEQLTDKDAMELIDKLYN